MKLLLRLVLAACLAAYCSRCCCSVVVACGGGLCVEALKQSACAWRARRPRSESLDQRSSARHPTCACVCDTVRSASRASTRDARPTRTHTDTQPRERACHPTCVAPRSYDIARLLSAIVVSDCVCILACVLLFVLALQWRATRLESQEHSCTGDSRLSQASQEDQVLGVTPVAQARRRLGRDHKRDRAAEETPPPPRDRTHRRRQQRRQRRRLVRQRHCGSRSWNVVPLDCAVDTPRSTKEQVTVAAPASGNHSSRHHRLTRRRTRPSAACDAGPAVRRIQQAVAR